MKRALFFAGVAWLIPGVAFAQPSDADRATARSLAHEGYDAQQRGHYAVAADRFSRADALVHAPTLLLGLARAQVGLGRLVAAHETYERILREPLEPRAPAVFAKALEDAKQEVAALEPRLAWVTIQVEGPASPDVTIDDVPVPVASLGSRRPLDPGSHVVKASAQGFEAVENTFAVAEGGEQAVTLPMVPQPAAPAPVAAPLHSEPPSSPVQVKLAIVSMGIGAAGLITGTVAGILTLSKHSSLAGTCPGGICPAGDKGEVSSYTTVADLSTVAFIVGGVGAALGVTLLFTAPKARELGAYVGPGSIGVIGTF